MVIHQEVIQIAAARIEALWINAKTKSTSEHDLKLVEQFANYIEALDTAHARALWPAVRNEFGLIEQAKLVEWFEELGVIVDAH